MIDFVLDVGCLDVGEVFGNSFQYRCLVLEFDGERPIHKTPDPWDGETALEPAVLFLFVDRAKHFLAGRDDFGVDENLGGLFLFIKEDKETFVETDLGGGQSDAFGVGCPLQNFFHLFDFFGGFFVPVAKRLSFVLQEWMGSSQNLHRVYFTIDL